MDKLRVVELGFWVAGPSVGGVLADWGADVVKIEPPKGDPMRGFYQALLGMNLPLNPAFELDNRSKRSLAVDLETEAAQAIVLELVDRADVFISNLRPKALERYGFDYASLSARNPRLVYGSVTGYGLSGPDRDRPAYDIGAFWSRAGIAAALTPEGREPPFQRAAMGDHTAGITLAGGIAAALFARERTGRGQLVSTSLLRIGVFTIGSDVNAVLRLGAATTPMTRDKMLNPAVSCYRTSDQRWFWLLGLQGDRHWPDLARSVGRPEWIDDPELSTMRTRTKKALEVIRALDVIFATKTLAEWAEIFDREGMWWAPVQTTTEVVADEQAIASGAFVDVPLEDGSARMVASPVDFSDTRWAPRATAPELGQHTEEVLLEMGYDWERIAALKEKGAIP